MIILGIDPGTTSMGFALINDRGSALTAIEYGTTAIREPALADKLHALRLCIESLIAKYHPAVAGVEKLFFAKNKKTALEVAHARGVILATLRAHDIPLFELTPAQVKIAVTNYGRADKPMISKMVAHLLGLSALTGDDNAADALAVAIATAGAARQHNALNATK